MALLSDEIWRSQLIPDDIRSGQSSRPLPANEVWTGSQRPKVDRAAIGRCDAECLEKIAEQPRNELAAEAQVDNNDGSNASSSILVGLSRINVGDQISGTLEFQGLAKIEGYAEGEIVGDEIEIGPIAVVRARVTANRLTIAGQVSGELVARCRIELLATARVRCTIAAPKLVVCEGAQFNGDCKMPRQSTGSPC